MKPRLFVQFVRHIQVLGLASLLLLSTVCEGQDTIKAEAPALNLNVDEIGFALSESQRIWLKENPTILFSGDPDWLPFEAFDDNGLYVGIVADYLKELQSLLPMKIQTIPVSSWLETLERSKDGTIDMISGDIDDVVLAENYFPIKPYFNTPIVIVMRDDEPFVNDLPDIASRTIAIGAGGGYTSKLFENYPNISFTKDIGGVGTALEGVSVGKYEAAVLSMPNAGYVIRSKGYNNLKIVGKTNVVMKVTLFVSKDKPMLHQIINQAMQTIPSAKHQQILKEWMEVEFAETVNYKPILQIAGTFTLLLLLSLFTNRKISKARREANELRALAEMSRTLAETQKAKSEELAVKLSRYLSSQIYDMLFRGKEESSLSPRRKKLTIFFSDIAGFTNMTETLESEELTSLLNNYLTEMTDIALKYGATVDKYIGDAIVIFFGDPESQGYRQDALNCVKMAIEMQVKLKDIQESIMDQGILDDFKIRMGINTGYCTVGNFGSSNRMDYTVIGNAVNIAARLESKATHDTILISHETWSLVKDEITYKKQDPINVKGITKDLQTYLVTGLINSTDQSVSYNVPGLKLELDKNSMSSKQDILEILDEIKDALK